MTTRYKIISSMVSFLNSDKKHYDILYNKFRLDFLKDVKPTFGTNFMVRDIDSTNISNDDLIIFSMRSIVYDLLNKSDHFVSLMLEDQLSQKYENFKTLNLFDNLQIQDNNDQLKDATNHLLQNENFRNFIREYGKTSLINIKKDEAKKSQVSFVSL